MTGSPEAHRLDPNGGFPNSRLPLLVYRGGVVGQGDVGQANMAEAMERIFTANGWGNGWRNGIYGFHHCHSTAHEVLGVAKGSVKVQFGGEGGPVVELAEGDVAAIPAGVAHCNRGQSADFLVVGGYADGRDWDVRRGEPSERGVVEAAIAAVPAPKTDPLHGEAGALPSLWPSVPEAPQGVA